MKKKKESVFKGDQVMVLLENMNKGIEVIAEDQQYLKKDLGSVKEDLGSFKKEMTDFKKEVRSDMSDVKSELSEIKYKLDRKVSYDDFEKLEKRVLKLENIKTAA